jgi:AraC family transcriptional activator of pobA
MAKDKIPVYSISNLAAKPLDPGEFMIEAFEAYLGRHSPSLHQAHRHTFYHLVCFTGGKGSHSIDFTKFPVEAGQVYFMIPGQVHSWNFDGVPTGYVVNFSGDFLRSFLLDANYLDRFSFFSGDAADSVVRLDPATRSSVFRLLGQMVENYQRGRDAGHDTGRDTGRDAEPDLLRTQLVQLFLLVKSGIESVRPAVPVAVTQKQQVMGSFRKLLDQHYKTKRMPSDYAALLFVTPNHLNVMSRDVLGRSAGEVIRDRVLLEAKRLLTNAGMSQTEIADELNFADTSYFNRFFKKYEGVTPEEFRRRHVVK